MENFWFYVKLGLNHVLDIGAYDHILFLAALAAPFTFKSWQKIVILATIFTVAHCTSLALSAYGILSVNVEIIEFLIPVTIMATAVYNSMYCKHDAENKSLFLLGLATTFFGLVHGFGFSNYFRMLMAEEVEKFTPLLGFATGIELSQVFVILGVLLLAYIFQSVLGVKRWIFTAVLSILIIMITVPLLITTFPG